MVIYDFDCPCDREKPSLKTFGRHREGRRLKKPSEVSSEVPVLSWEALDCSLWLTSELLLLSFPRSTSRNWNYHPSSFLDRKALLEPVKQNHAPNSLLILFGNEQNRWEFQENRDASTGSCFLLFDFSSVSPIISLVC